MSTLADMKRHYNRLVANISDGSTEDTQIRTDLFYIIRIAIEYSQKRSEEKDLIMALFYSLTHILDSRYFSILAETETHTERYSFAVTLAKLRPRLFENKIKTLHRSGELASDEMYQALLFSAAMCDHSEADSYFMLNILVRYDFSLVNALFKIWQAFFLEHATTTTHITMDDIYTIKTDHVRLCEILDLSHSKNPIKTDMQSHLRPYVFMGNFICFTLSNYKLDEEHKAQIQRLSDAILHIHYTAKYISIDMGVGTMKELDLKVHDRLEFATGSLTGPEHITLMEQLAPEQFENFDMHSEAPWLTFVTSSCITPEIRKALIPALKQADAFELFRQKYTSDSIHSEHRDRISIAEALILMSEQEHVLEILKELTTTRKFVPDVSDLFVNLEKINTRPKIKEIQDLILQYISCTTPEVGNLFEATQLNYERLYFIISLIQLANARAEQNTTNPDGAKAGAGGSLTPTEPEKHNHTSHELIFYAKNLIRMLPPAFLSTHCILPQKNYSELPTVYIAPKNEMFRYANMTLFSFCLENNQIALAAEIMLAPEVYFTQILPIYDTPSSMVKTINYIQSLFCAHFLRSRIRTRKVGQTSLPGLYAREMGFSKPNPQHACILSKLRDVGMQCEKIEAALRDTCYYDSEDSDDSASTQADIGVPPDPWD